MIVGVFDDDVISADYFSIPVIGTIVSGNPGARATILFTPAFLAYTNLVSAKSVPESDSIATKG